MQEQERSWELLGYMDISWMQVLQQMPGCFSLA
jgi:hypothetical protein